MQLHSSYLIHIPTYALKTPATRSPSGTRPSSGATATPVVKSDYKQETSLVVGMTAASKI